MKKLITPLMAVIAVVGIALATTTFTAPTNYQNLGPADIVYSWDVSTEAAPSLSGYTPGTKQDTLTGIDSITFLDKFPLDARAYYAFQIVDSSGTADSLRLSFKAYDLNGNATAWTIGDTIAGAAANKFITCAMPTTIAYKPAYISVRGYKWIATLVSKVRHFNVIKFPIK